MNNCLNCGKLVKNKFCNVSCQNEFQNTQKNDKKYGKFVDYSVKCISCAKIFIVNEREKLHPQKKKYYCSRSCANKRKHSQGTKDKISLKLKTKKRLTVNCEYCGNSFEQKRETQRFCGNSCSTKFRMPLRGYERIGGLCSVKSQNKRGKNEIFFAKLCCDKFKSVLCNEQIFNGWDADVIIEDYKIAVLWNGVWHYKKISKNHSLLQTENRDKLKIKEIVNCGYEPYVIKDLGKFNKTFVIKEFENFKKYCGV